VRFVAHKNIARKYINHTFQNQSIPPMKQFFKNLLTSCLGSTLGLFATFGIIFWLFSGLLSSAPEEVKPNSVLKLTLNKAIPELTDNTDRSISNINSFFDSNIGLNDLLKSIDYAATDKNIKGIYLELSNVPVGLSSAKKIRQRLEEFKNSGKFVIAYANAYSQRSYYIASAADRIYLNPMGGIDFQGFAAQIMFFKGLLDKLGIKTNVFYVGKFKSATEPFRRTDMSPENRLQTREFIEGAYSLYLEAIAESRKIPVAELRNIADNALLRNANDAIKYKFADSLYYKDQVLSELRTRTGIEAKDEIPAISIDKYYASIKDKLKSKGAIANTIAVVYAEGSIVDGEGELGSIGGDKYARIIRTLRQDKNIKAIVLRINSGGGSALASEIIWREIELAKAQGIRVVATMGDVAASGGYYIAANADCIYAENNTITGSIGVFGMAPNMRELYESKLGLTMDTIKTGKYSTMTSDMGNYYDFSAEEANIIQTGVEEIYATFKKRVSDGRKIPFADVDTLAQGRVWLGNTAQKIRLVDSLGGLDQAIIEAAKLANVTDYRIMNYPAVKPAGEQLMSSLLGTSENASIGDYNSAQRQSIEAAFPELADFFHIVKDLRQMRGVQARMPFHIIIN
jgi:protease-4